MAQEAWQWASDALPSAAWRQLQEKEARSGGHLPDLRGRGPSFTDLTFSVVTRVDTENYPGFQGSPTRQERSFISEWRACVVRTGGLPAWSTYDDVAAPQATYDPADPRRGGYLVGGAGCRIFPGNANPPHKTCAGAVGWCFGAERARAERPIRAEIVVGFDLRSRLRRGAVRVAGRSPHRRVRIVDRWIGEVGIEPIARQPWSRWLGCKATLAGGRGTLKSC